MIEYDRINLKVCYAYKLQILQLYFHSGCQASGVYGDSCKDLCPTYCKDNVCHIQNGTCFGCSPGWTDKTTCTTSMVFLPFL